MIHHLTKKFLSRRDLLGWALATTAATSSPSALALETLPTYRTHMPAAATLQYHLRRGGWRGRGELRWQPAAGTYQIKLEGRVAGLRVMSWLSEGRLDEAMGIVPQRFTDQRYGKDPRVATFDQTRGLITYAQLTDTAPWVAGIQDRVSWMVQIAAIANARPAPLARGEHIQFWVSGAQADVGVWSFESQGPETVNTAAGTVSAIKLLREPRKPNDTRVEVWLDPAREHLPVRARLAAHASDGEALELTLKPD